MRRHNLHPLPNAFQSHRDHRRITDENTWKHLDRVQVLGAANLGHSGCINALSWSEDGQTLLSGSDDKRICIWRPDTALGSSVSPHPLRWAETVATGHQANIFSAKYLPNANTPTIVSVAGDRDVRVYEVERLETELAPGGVRQLNGREGEGVRLFKCHRDRVKRIATENSPSLFLTVSEDGTVRQHDLRRPHVCPNECPEALFHAPRGIDLYSLSASTVAPHLFAVAGRGPFAYICDRRMLARQTPSWGSHVALVDPSNVHCVRKLGLPDEEWNKVSPRSGRWDRDPERHISCVKMSEDNPDEVIVSFMKHSTSLFSIYDSPFSPSARSPSSFVISPNECSPRPREQVLSPTCSRSPLSQSANQRLGSKEPNFQQLAEGQIGRVGKRRMSHRSEDAHMSDKGTSKSGSASSSTIDILDETKDTKGISKRREVEHEGRRLESLVSSYSEFTRPRLGISHSDEAGSYSALQYPSRRDEDEEMVDETVKGIGSDHRYVPEDFLNSPPSSGPSLMEDERPEISSQQYSAHHLPETTRTLAEFFEASDGTIEGQAPSEDEDEDVQDDDGELDADFLSSTIFGYPFGYSQSRAPKEAYDGVDTIHPRKMFFGARNVETVKDCNFLGLGSTKVASGSDDGNFFVWDKKSGKLEGIWEGDGSVVNVMEQHPSLPLVAVSGIDSTVKMFSPIQNRPANFNSFCRTHLSEQIIDRNLRSPRFVSGSLFERAALLQMLANRGINVRIARSGEEDGEEGDHRECVSQ
nr:hypothetical protein L203_06441 [Cryptococcus depauperatus CBS 7841]